MHLCEIPVDQISGLEIPNGLPIIFDLNSKCAKLLDDGTGRDPLEVHNFGSSASYLFRPCTNPDGSDYEQCTQWTSWRMVQRYHQRTVKFWTVYDAQLHNVQVKISARPMISLSQFVDMRVTMISVDRGWRAHLQIELRRNELNTLFGRLVFVVLDDPAKENWSSLCMNSRGDNLSCT